MTKEEALKLGVEIPSADEYKARIDAEIAKRKDDAVTLAVTFINNDLKPALLHLDEDKLRVNQPYRYQVAVKVPPQAYNDTEFYVTLSEILEAMGYTVEQTHDGGGMYEVYLVKAKQQS